MTRIGGLKILQHKHQWIDEEFDRCNTISLLTERMLQRVLQAIKQGVRKIRNCRIQAYYSLSNIRILK